ncbi:Hypothetical protein, putative, partial [Bodo saltans]
KSTESDICLFYCFIPRDDKNVNNTPQLLRTTTNITTSTTTIEPMFQTSSPQHQSQQQAVTNKTLIFDADASVNSGMSLTSSRASLALTASTLSSQASPMFSNNSGGTHNFLFSQRLGNNNNDNNTNTSHHAFGGASTDLLSFRMPTVQIQSQTTQSGEYYGSCFADDASSEQLWVASCIDESVSPQRCPGNGHVKNL